MKPIYSHFAGAIAVTLAVAACAPQPASTPTPAPAPAPAPTPTPTAVVQPVYQNWMDAPATPGDWTYRNGGTTTSAFFGPSSADARFTMTCNRSNRTITLARAGEARGQTSMIVRTETGNRTLAAQPFGAAPSVAAVLPANDRFLDAMAISKGRFAVEIPGMATLYVPSWPEVTRVIEDCR